MKNSYPLFWRLYLSIVAALLFIVLFFNLVLVYQDQSSYITDFLDDTAPVANIVGHALDSDLPWQQEKKNWRTYFNFDVSVIDKKQFDILKSRADFLENINDVLVFELHEEEGLSAVYRYARQYIVISDINHDLPPAEEFRLQQEDRDNQRSADDDRLTWLFSSLLILTLALVIYWPSRQINQHVKKLVNSSKKLGKGDLSAHADEQAPAPLNDIAKSFNVMASDLRRTAEEQQVMSHAISHELRAPLSKMQLVNSLLSKQDLPDSAFALLNDSNRYIDELESLTNQILTLAKINHQQELSLVDINLSQLIEERISFLKVSHIDICFTPTNVIYLQADAFYLQLLLDNLIKNALKYANQRVKIRIIHQQKMITVNIEDDGPGIPPDQRKTVFVPFSRLDSSRNRHSGGFGLGLAIADSAAHLHKGKITISDSPLGGAEFVVAFPITED